jgi:hypothetical protein
MENKVAQGRRKPEIQMQIPLLGSKLRRLLPRRNALLRLPGQLGAVTADSTPDRPLNADALDESVLAGRARKAYADRQRRALIPGTEGLFGEPAWDILLDLFVAAREGRQVALESACSHAGVPDANAQRWVAILEKRGMVVRESSPQARWREYVRLTPQAYEDLAEHFRKG